MNVSPDFYLSRSYRQPYPHAWIPRLFPEYANDQALLWLEQTSKWNFTETDFYRQFEFSLKEHPPPAELEFLASGDTLTRMTDWAREAFGVNGIEPTDIVAHRLDKGHGIGVHNDCLEHGETVRLIFHLNRKVGGGEFALLQDQRAESVCKVIRPKHGTAFAFIITEHSYHAVSRIHLGRRFSIVYSFRPCP